MTSHYTWRSMTALHDFGGVLGRPLDFFFWFSQFHGQGSWRVCEVALIVSLHHHVPLSTILTSVLVCVGCLNILLSTTSWRKSLVECCIHFIEFHSFMVLHDLHSFGPREVKGGGRVCTWKWWNEKHMILCVHARHLPREFTTHRRGSLSFCVDNKLYVGFILEWRERSIKRWNSLIICSKFYFDTTFVISNPLHCNVGYLH